MPALSMTLDRRTLLKAALGGAVALALAACSNADAAGPRLAGSAPIPTAVPPGTALSIAAFQGQGRLQLELAGLATTLPFKVSEWPNIGAGPDVINAFRATSLDVANNAGIPPIQSHYQQFGAKIVAVDLTRKPNYLFATKPGSDIRDVAGFRGRKLAFSQGQAQGVVLLRALAKAGISDDEVTLVPLTSNQFLTALQAGQVDVAPLGISQGPPYFEKYGKDGARQIETDVVDLLSVLWAPDRVLEDPAKAAALASYIPLWAQGLVWTHEHPEEWDQKFYVDTQNLSLPQARAITALANKPLFPRTWDEAIAWEQETVDLLAKGGFVKGFDASVLFDRRFEPLASGAVADTYRS